MCTDDLFQLKDMDWVIIYSRIEQEIIYYEENKMVEHEIDILIKKKYVKFGIVKIVRV